jgi:hypothetical protein
MQFREGGEDGRHGHVLLPQPFGVSFSESASPINNNGPQLPIYNRASDIYLCGRVPTQDGTRDGYGTDCRRCSGSHGPNCSEGLIQGLGVEEALGLLDGVC